MSLLKKFWDLLLHDGVPASYRSTVAQAQHKQNTINLQIGCFVLVLVAIGLNVMAVALHSLVRYVAIYHYFLATALVLFALAEIVPKRFPKASLPLWYVTLGVVFLFTAHVELHLNRGSSGTIYCALLLSAPMMFLDKPWRSNLYMEIAAGFYMGCAWFMSSGDIRDMNLISALSSLFITLVLNTITTRKRFTTLSGIALTQQLAHKLSDENESQQVVINSCIASGYVLITQIAPDTGACSQLTIKDGIVERTDNDGGLSALLEYINGRVHLQDRQRVKDQCQRTVEENTLGNNRTLLYRTVPLEPGDPDSFHWHETTALTVKLGASTVILFLTKDVTDTFRLREEQENLKLENAMLENKSRRDSMTNLLNKAALQAEVSSYLVSHPAYESAFLFLDLDNFKLVNDQLGHAMGDLAIRQCTRKLQTLFANLDYISRFGGDEFCIFLPNIPRRVLEDKLAFTCGHLMETYTEGDVSVTVTASIGCAYVDCETISYQRLAQAADEALYEVKNSGKNGYHMKILRQ